MDDPPRLFGTLVKEQMAAPLKPARPRMRDACCEHLRVLNRAHDIRRPVHDERRSHNVCQAIPKIAGACKGCLLRREHAGLHWMQSTLRDLRCDEIGMRSLEVRRIQDRACEAISIPGRARALSQQCVHGARIRRYRLAPGWSRGGQQQVINAVWVVNSQLLRDRSAHRSAEDVRARERETVEHGDAIACHQWERQLRIAAVGRADTARIVGDDTVAALQRWYQRLEDTGGSAETRYEQNRLMRCVAVRRDSETHPVLGDHALRFCHVPAC